MRRTAIPVDDKVRDDLDKVRMKIQVKINKRMNWNEFFEYVIQNLK